MATPVPPGQGTAEAGRIAMNALLTEYGFVALPAAIIVTVVILLYARIRRAEEQKRQAVRAAELATEAEQAKIQAADLAALIRFSQTLNFCTDAQALSQTIVRELPRLVGHQPFWVRTTAGQPELVVAPAGELVIPAEPVAWETFPLIAGGRTVGVLGIQQQAGPAIERHHRTLEMAALILAVSIRNVQLFARISNLTMLDPLTGCLTKHRGMEMFAAELRRAQRTNTITSMLLLQVDQLPSLIEEHGEAIGDQLLARLGRLFKREFRASDVKCRYGTSDFAFMLPDTRLAGAAKAAHDLRQKVAELMFRVNGEILTVTASIGVAEASTFDIDPLDPLRRAEAALSRAISQGRNTVTITEPFVRQHRTPA